MSKRDKNYFEEQQIGQGKEGNLLLYSHLSNEAADNFVHSSSWKNPSEWF